nr:unnamed protein product [Callosobruchus analis]
MLLHQRAPSSVDQNMLSLLNCW